MAEGLPLIHTIGHSDLTVAEFLELLRRHGITMVVDVRSQPYSRWTPQFNREILSRNLRDGAVAYRFMGTALGGHASDPALHDPGQGRPDYQRMEQSPRYRAGIDQLLELTQAQRVAVMCSEGDHRHCHRHLLIAQTLLAHGARVLHIQTDGTTVKGERVAQQLSFLWG